MAHRPRRLSLCHCVFQLDLNRRSALSPLPTLFFSPVLFVVLLCPAPNTHLLSPPTLSSSSGKGNYSSIKTGEVAVLHCEVSVAAAGPGRSVEVSDSLRNFSDHQHLNTGCSGTSCAETSPSDRVRPGDFWSPLGPQTRCFRSKLEPTHPVRLEVSEGDRGIHLFYLQSSLVEFFPPQIGRAFVATNFPVPRRSLKKNFLVRLACVEI